MKDHEIAELVNALRDVALQFHGAQQLRERIAGLVLPVVKALNEQATTNELMAESMDLFRQDMIDLQIIPAHVPPMFMTEAICTALMMKRHDLLLDDAALWAAAVKHAGTELLGHRDTQGALVFRTAQEFGDCIRAIFNHE